MQIFKYAGITQINYAKHTKIIMMQILRNVAFIV